MSDKGYSILVTVAKYFFLNFLGLLLFMYFGSGLDLLLITLLIINCTAILMGRMQKILDKLNELNKEDNNI